MVVVVVMGMIKIKNRIRMMGIRSMSMNDDLEHDDDVHDDDDEHDG